MRMRLPCVGPFHEIDHCLLSDLWAGCCSVLQRVVKADRVRHRLIAVHGVTHVAQVVDSHAGYDDKNSLFSELADCLAELEVFDWVVVVEERYLNNWYLQRVLFWIESFENGQQQNGAYKDNI